MITSARSPACTDTVAETGAQHVVTLMTDVAPVQRPPSIAEANHLLLGMDDIVDHDGRLHRIRPRRMSRELIDFVARLGPQRADRRPLLRRDQPLDRRRLHHRLRAQAATATRSSIARAHPRSSRRPRRRIRAGRRSPTHPRPRTAAWSHAIAAIGRGRSSLEGSLSADPFRLDLE